MIVCACFTEISLSNARSTELYTHGGLMLNWTWLQFKHAYNDSIAFIVVDYFLGYALNFGCNLRLIRVEHLVDFVIFFP